MFSFFELDQHRCDEFGHFLFVNIAAAVCVHLSPNLLKVFLRCVVRELEVTIKLGHVLFDKALNLVFAERP